jgi:hypothetical protein
VYENPSNDTVHKSAAEGDDLKKEVIQAAEDEGIKIDKTVENSEGSVENTETPKEEERSDPDTQSTDDEDVEKKAECDQAQSKESDEEDDGDQEENSVDKKAVADKLITKFVLKKKAVKAFNKLANSLG